KRRHGPPATCIHEKRAAYVAYVASTCLLSAHSPMPSTAAPAATAPGGWSRGSTSSVAAPAASAIRSLVSSPMSRGASTVVAAPSPTCVPLSGGSSVGCGSVSVVVTFPPRLEHVGELDRPALVEHAHRSRGRLRGDHVGEHRQQHVVVGRRQLVPPTGDAGQI